MADIAVPCSHLGHLGTLAGPRLASPRDPRISQSSAQRLLPRESRPVPWLYNSQPEGKRTRSWEASEEGKVCIRIPIFQITTWNRKRCGVLACFINPLAPLTPQTDLA